eukprot:TRINITY_DN2138_c0_g1_i2.p1 TRINITY_DN2138_c0_g1~~TRINITY_DN2138_c0_g1_i2.p1  ORF type:complete len:337 (+),score=43.27 TRINITY_DN2138_c0_g1_i2:679-1689(+)
MLDQSQLLALVDKVNTAYEKVSKDLELQQMVDLDAIPHFELKPHTADPRALTPTGAFSSKHSPQHDSVLAHLRHLNALNSDSIFVEYGAGRGTLSWIISQATGGSDHILIDRGHFRRKAETRVRSSEKDPGSRPNGLFVRVQADIKDFDMTKMPQLLSSAGVKKHVAFSKHLCGAATDLTLRCIKSAKSSESTTSVAPNVVFIALCCHQKCGWKPFCNKSCFLDMGFSRDEFDLIRALSCWAVCRIVTPTAADPQQSDGSSDDEAPPAEPTSAPLKQVYSVEEREEIGNKCKRLLDFCRIQYLRSMGYDVVLVRYCQKNITPENVAMIAVKQGTLA